MGFFGTILLLVAAAIFLVGWRFLDPRPRLVIDERGIRDRTLPLGCIRWDEIEGAWPPTLDDANALRLKLRLNERIRRRLGRWSGRLRRASESIEIRLDLAGTDIGPVELLQEILVRTGGPRPHPADGSGCA